MAYEDVIHAPRQRPETLTAEHDGVTLEQVVGDLQSDHGVPESPQEFRITLRVAESREAREDARTAVEAVRDEKPDVGAPPDEPPTDGRPKREKAPAAPRIGAGDQEAGAPRRRRRRRRRGRGAKPPQ